MLGSTVPHLPKVRVLLPLGGTCRKQKEILAADSEWGRGRGCKRPKAVKDISKSHGFGKSNTF